MNYFDSHSNLLKKEKNVSCFSYNLKILRQEKHLTQPQLADALHVSKGMISFWENGIYEPTATNIIMVALFFNVSIDELLLNPLL